MKTDLQSALAFDSPAEAERLTGINYKESDAVAFLGLALQREQQKATNALLFLNNDTNSWNQTLAEWMECVERLGFALVLCDDIKGTGDKFRVWWRDGVLLKADSFGGDKRVNSSSAYFNYQGPRGAMERCSNGYAGERDGVPVWSGDVDAREGLRHSLDTMAAAGELLAKWIQRPHLWLLSYVDTKELPKLHAERVAIFDTITNERIARLPQEIRDAITP